MRGAEFTLVVKYRLGLPVYDSAGPCPACLRHSDVFGDHALCCGSGGERISRHNALRDALYETAVAAGLGPTKEGRFLLPGNDRRPADILVPHWSTGPVHNVYIVQFFFPSTERGQTYLKISVLSYHSTYICPSSFDRGENGEKLISVTLKL